MSLDTLTRRLAALEKAMTPEEPRKIYFCSARHEHFEEDVDAYFASIGEPRPSEDDDSLTVVRTIVLVPKRPDDEPVEGLPR